MIRLTRLDGAVVHLNVDMIVSVEELGGAVIKLNSGDTMRVTEDAAEIVDRCHEARAEILRRAFGVRVPAEVLASA